MKRVRVYSAFGLAAALCAGAAGCATADSTPSGANDDSRQTIQEACDALNGSAELAQSLPELGTSITALLDAIQNGTDAQAAGDKVTELANATAQGYENAHVTNADLAPMVSSYVTSLKSLADAQTAEDYNAALGAMKETSVAMKEKCDGA